MAVKRAKSRTFVPTRPFIRSFITAEGHRGQRRRDGRRPWRDERSFEAARLTSVRIRR
jgi:hypothetical protein